MTANTNTKISKRDEGDLLTIGATITRGLATLRVTGAGGDKRYTMEGPSGVHSLLVIATDLARLNAHWSIFATRPANVPAA